MNGVKYVTDTPEITVAGSGSAGGDTSGYLTFASLPTFSSAMISKATLRIYYKLPTASASSLIFRVLKQWDSNLVLCQQSLATTSTFAPFDCDVTDVVKSWLNAGSPTQNQRTFTLTGMPYGSFAVGATEGPPAFASRIIIDYQTSCGSMKCKKF
jgi:hypothetical protein